MSSKYGRRAYASPGGRKSPALTTPRFYLSILFGPLLWLWLKARKNECDDFAWNYGSLWMADIFENLGGRIILEGLENIGAEPCVFIANHMSVLETFLLPGIIRPFKPVTFVVKDSLTTMPVFGAVMRSREPVAVRRVNPREDLATVLEEGAKRLSAGVSIVVFPQSTRSLRFDPAMFNSIGVKLARKTNAPVVPLALKTDAWGLGRKIREAGKIRLDLPARFRFGQAIKIKGSGKQEHLEITRFIGETVAAWQTADGVNE